ncbi:hypothetical protein A3715_07335 [Oleiphilus sp. HI0009]|nr:MULTISPECIES: AraC family transcriptional regulator [unclassified Oleiphilus]KZX81340.1 hypothetical protein A3715_07335 [Oleiphilus sp. HI0009]KZY70796.1 hypothetical protein A3739_05960 [Oleiphilus sp. HI0067]KZY72207.1 hypothetical protein A3738_14320 [Oleiphilus sp. HI0066]
MIPIQKLSLGDITVNFASVVLNTLAEHNIDPLPVQKAFGLNNEHLSTPDARISIPKYMRLGREAARMTRSPSIGLEFGRNTLDSHIGLAGYTAACAPTLQQSLSHIIDMELLNSRNTRGKSSHFMKDGRLHCQFYSISPYNRYNYFVVDTMLASWWSFTQRHCPEAECHHIEIEYPLPSYKEDFEDFFQCPVLFGQSKNALILKRGHETFALNQSHQPTFSKMQAICEQELMTWKSGKSISDQVIDLISENLSGKPPEIDLIGKKLGLAGWTLRRKLAQEGHHYQTLLDNTRNALAQSYVRDTGLNFTEITFILGFSSPSSFQRAFKRWTGISPGAYRRDIKKKEF